MATFAPISGLAVQFQKNQGGAAASDFFIKLFAAGTTTPILMATDSTGGTLLAKARLNSTGYVRTEAGEDAIFIPHIDQSYKISLFPTEADADANTNAVWTIDNVSTASSILADTTNRNFETVAAMVAETDLASGQFISVEDYATGNNSGVLFFKVVAAGTGTADAGAFIDLPNTTPALQAKQNLPAIRTVKMWGADGSASAAVNTAAFDNGSLVSNNLFVPSAIYEIDAIDLAPDTELWGNGDTSELRLTAGATGINKGCIITDNTHDVEVHHLSFTNPSAVASSYGILNTLSNNVEQKNLNYHDCSFDGFAIHGVAVNGHAPVEADDSNAGYVNIKVNDNRFNAMGSSAFIPFSNCENIEFIGNVVTNSSSTPAIKVDSFSRNIVIAWNVSDGSLGMEGGCEKFHIHHNIVFNKIFVGVGTVSGATGADGEPHFSCSRGRINDNFCTQVEVVGHAGHAASTGGDPYTWVARPYETAKKINVHDNIVLNATVPAYQFSRVSDCKVHDNLAENGSTNGYRFNEFVTGEVTNNKSLECGGTSDSSFLITGTSGRDTNDCEFINNQVISRDSIKTVAEVSHTEFVDDIESSGWSIDPGTTNASLIGVQYNNCTNIRVNKPTLFINPIATEFSIGATATFKDGNRQMISDRLPFNATTEVLMVSLTSGRIGVTDAHLLYEVAQTTGTNAVIEVGSTVDPDRNATQTTSVQSQWADTSMTILSATSPVDVATTVSVTLGSGNDGVGRVVLTYSEL